MHCWPTSGWSSKLIKEAIILCSRLHLLKECNYRHHNLHIVDGTIIIVAIEAIAMASKIIIGNSTRNF
jgi:hypothetical protein